MIFCFGVFTYVKYLAIFRNFTMLENIELLNGDIYKDAYEKKKELGRGKFGVVFQVEDKVTKKIYAAKHIKTRKREQKEKALEEIAI